MNKKNRNTIIIVIVLSFITLAILGTKSMKNYKINENIYNEMKNNSIMYSDNATINDLKAEYGIRGEDSLYEIQTEYDGRKVVSVKQNINYRIAFAGMIKKSIPEYEEIEKIFEDNYPKESGIWIDKNSRKKIIDFLNSNSNSKYEINREGYLKIKEKNGQNDNDAKIEKIINGDKKYILSISSVCYMVDTLNGKIVENPYEDLNEYQTYEYFEYDNNMIIFITENKKEKIAKDEIFESILNLI